MESKNSVISQNPRNPYKVRDSPIRKTVISNKKPLTEPERGLLLAGFRVDAQNPDSDYRTTRVIWSTGCHPWSLRNAGDCRWRITEQEGHRYVRYIRAKTLSETQLDLDPGIETWLLDFVKDQGGFTEREYHRRVKTYGKRIGLEGLGPRALRHDRIYLTARACGWDLSVATAMFGTSANVLLGYMASDRARTYSEKILKEAFT